MEFYPVDSAMQPLNNRGQVCTDKLAQKNYL